MRLPGLILAAVLGSSAIVASSQHDVLQGSLQIRGATIVDPPAEEPKNTHAAFIIGGAAAKTLYDAIQAKPEADECLGDGSLRKRAGNLSCLRRADDGQYECDFAIDLGSQKIEPGRAC